MHCTRQLAIGPARLACAALAAALGSAPAQAADEAKLSAEPAQATKDEAKLSTESDSKRWWLIGDDGVTLPGVFADWHFYLKDGSRIDRSDGSLKLKFNASVWADAGDIDANDVLETAFPDLTGNVAQFSRARVTMRGLLRDVGDFKFQLEFAQQRQIKDMWFRFELLPYVGRIRVGNMREPYSLENSTGGDNLTFMSRALPTLALAPGRNIGIATTNTAFDKRITWSAGGFWNTGSFDNFGGAKDALSNSIGTDLVARVTGLARYADEGRDLIHLGLSLSHQNFNDQVRTRAVPETALTTDDLVDTGKISPNSAIQINPEFAIVSGPWSFQAEYFHSALKANSAGNSRLNGIYAFGSYLLTGESRHYDRGAGVFDGVRPKRKFEWGGDGWGAWEVALRVSTVDLTDGALGGGRQTDLTAGLNWYINDKAKVMLNYVHGRVNDRSSQPAVDGGRVNILQARVAANF
jgi:phosphate-selective porin OprO/OprP